MKIKTRLLSYEEVISLPPFKRPKPKKPSFLLSSVIRLASIPDMMATKFTFTKSGMEKLASNEPCLYLMNHSSFIDLKAVSKMLYPRPYNIVCTLDGFIGKAWLMKNIGCIPTTKFVSDISLVKDMKYALTSLRSSVLMFPEAGYSFDGTATTLPESIGQCIKYLGVPVVMIRTFGAFSRDPLYNGLRLRKVKVSAEMEYILSPDDIEKSSVDEINSIIKEQFSFDSFRWQKENRIAINEDFRAEGLNRVLYKCPSCKTEGKTETHNSEIRCNACGKSYFLDEYGTLKANDGNTEFDHIPDWYAWERECVKNEVLSGSYRLEVPVDIYMIVNSKALYKVGDGNLTHSAEGFKLTGCGGKLEYTQRPTVSYSLNSDFFWYEIGDMISIGTHKRLFYCFPKSNENIVAKTRLAAEEIYKITRKR